MPNRHRLHRSELAVPGSNPRMLEKAPGAGADVVFLDLEDSVAPDDKVGARANVIRALDAFDWSRCLVAVRINSVDTPWCHRDVIDVVEAAGARLDAILVPKVNQPSDVAFVATLLDQLEAGVGRAPIRLHALVETALGMANVDAIAQCCPARLEALVFGVADYAASTRARTTCIGASSPDYPGDPWHYPLSRLVVACRAYGLRAIDGPFGNIGDPAGFLASARRAAALGCEGKWAIHPSQVPLANEVFTPAREELERARAILEAMRRAASNGKGAVSLDGRLIDAASIRMAENIVARTEQIDRRVRLRAHADVEGGQDLLG